MYSLEQIFQQAKELRTSAKMSYDGVDSVVWYGVKISHNVSKDQYTIYNVSNKGDYYEELSEEEYANFILNGWELACYDMSIANYERKVQKIKDLLYPESNRTPHVNRMIDNYLSNIDTLTETINKIKWKKNQRMQSSAK
jgi:hypothetical protein